jgi:hypothetical protein
VKYRKDGIGVKTRYAGNGGVNGSVGDKPKTKSGGRGAAKWAINKSGVVSAALLAP